MNRPPRNGIASYAAPIKSPDDNSRVFVREVYHRVSRASAENLAI